MDRDDRRTRSRLLLSRQAEDTEDRAPDRSTRPVAHRRSGPRSRKAGALATPLELVHRKAALAHCRGE